MDDMEPLPVAASEIGGFRGRSVTWHLPRGKIPARTECRTVMVPFRKEMLNTLYI